MTPVVEDEDWISEEAQQTRVLRDQIADLASDIKSKPLNSTAIDYAQKVDTSLDGFIEAVVRFEGKVQTSELDSRFETVRGTIETALSAVEEFNERISSADYLENALTSEAGDTAEAVTRKVDANRQKLEKVTTTLLKILPREDQRADRSRVESLLGAFVSGISKTLVTGGGPPKNQTASRLASLSPTERQSIFAGLIAHYEVFAADSGLAKEVLSQATEQDKRLTKHAEGVNEKNIKKQDAALAKVLEKDPQYPVVLKGAKVILTELAGERKLENLATLFQSENGWRLFSPMVKNSALNEHFKPADVGEQVINKIYRKEVFKDDELFAAMSFDGKHGKEIKVLIFKDSQLMHTVLGSIQRFFETDGSDSAADKDGKRAVGHDYRAKQLAIYLNANKAELTPEQIKVVDNLLVLGALRKDIDGNYDADPNVAVLAVAASDAQSRPALFYETVMHEVLGHGLHFSQAAQDEAITKIKNQLEPGEYDAIVEILQILGYTRKDNPELFLTEFAAYMRDAITLLTEARTSKGYQRQRVVELLRVFGHGDQIKARFSKIQNDFRALEKGYELGNLVRADNPLAFESKFETGQSQLQANVLLSLYARGPSGNYIPEQAATAEAVSKLAQQNSVSDLDVYTIIAKGNQAIAQRMADIASKLNNKAKRRLTITELYSTSLSGQSASLSPEEVAKALNEKMQKASTDALQRAVFDQLLTPAKDEQGNSVEGKYAYREDVTLAQLSSLAAAMGAEPQEIFRLIFKQGEEALAQRATKLLPSIDPSTRYVFLMSAVRQAVTRGAPLYGASDGKLVEELGKLKTQDSSGPNNRMVTILETARKAALVTNVPEDKTTGRSEHYAFVPETTVVALFAFAQEHQFSLEEVFQLTYIPAYAQLLSAVIQNERMHDVYVLFDDFSVGHVLAFASQYEGDIKDPQAVAAIVDNILKRVLDQGARLSAGKDSLDSAGVSGAGASMMMPVDLPATVALSSNLAGARIAGQGALTPTPATAFNNAINLLMEAGANGGSNHIVSWSTLAGKTDVAEVINSMNLGQRKNFAVLVSSYEEEATARLALGTAVAIVVAKSYEELNETLKGGRYILTVGIDQRDFAKALLRDGSNQAAIIDSPMKQTLSAQDVLVASYLAGAGQEKILAITGKGNPTPELRSFLSFLGWTYRILRSPFEVLSEIYKMLRQTAVAA